MAPTVPDYDQLKQQRVERMGGLLARASLHSQAIDCWEREDHFVEYITYNGDPGERIPA